LDETDYDVYLIRADADGDTIWTRTYGGAYCDYSRSVEQTTDGGYIITGHTGVFGVTEDVYLIKTDANGDTLWTRRYGGGGRERGWSVKQTADGGYVVAGWTESFGAGGRDIYLLKLHGHYPVITQVSDIPNDQGRQVTVSWHRSDYDGPGDTVIVTGYSLWRRIDDITSMEPGGVREGERNITCLAYPPGHWQYVLTVPARGEQMYSCVAPTLCDSTFAGLCWSIFFVSAMTPDPLVYFDSEPDSGYSVDNLAPAPPPNLRMSSPTALAWGQVPDEDFNYFAVYRSSISDLDSTAVLIGHTIEAQIGVSGEDHYYHVTATDFAGNEGDASTTENVFSGAGEAERLPTVYALGQNEPNPFRKATTIRFDLPRLSHVSLEVFDTRGKLTRTLTDQVWLGGRHSVIWSGETDFGQSARPGIYFIRLQSGDQVATRKVVLIR
jgi:hypothetical protein